MGQIKKVVIDINILVSAFGWGGIPRELLDLVEKCSIKNYISPELLAELKRVIAYPKLKFSERLQSRIIEFILIYSEVVEPKVNLSVIKNDSDDNRVIECALESKAEFIISGDAHLLSFKEYQGVRIVTATEFILRNS